MIEVLALRQSWAQPRESICWVIGAKGKYLFEVSGRETTGAPKKGFAARVAGGLGGAAFEVADVVAGGSEANYQDWPAGFVSGGRPDCTAAALVDVYRQCGGSGVWVLTDRRLALVGVSESSAEAESESVFARARRLGAGILNGEPVEADGGDQVDDGPVTPDVRTWQEWPRSSVAGFEMSTRKLGREYRGATVHYLVIQLTDGSTLEISPSATEAGGSRLVAMSYGRA